MTREEFRKLQEEAARRLEPYMLCAEDVRALRDRRSWERAAFTDGVYEREQLQGPARNALMALMIWRRRPHRLVAKYVSKGLALPDDPNIGAREWKISLMS